LRRRGETPGSFDFQPPRPTQVSLAAIFGGFVFSAVAGGFFGYYPGGENDRRGFRGSRPGKIARSPLAGCEGQRRFALPAR
jgi:hypothetical protein